MVSRAGRSVAVLGGVGVELEGKASLVSGAEQGERGGRPHLQGLSDLSLPGGERENPHLILQTVDTAELVAGLSRRERGSSRRPGGVVRRRGRF